MASTVETRLKMYILVKDTVPLGLAVNSVGHSTLACYRKFSEHPDTVEWVNSPSFAKTTCVVPSGQFEAAKRVEDHIVMTERALDGEETCIAFRPRREWPKHFQFFALFGSDIMKRIEKLETEKLELAESIEHMVMGMGHDEVGRLSDDSQLQEEVRMLQAENERLQDQVQNLKDRIFDMEEAAMDDAFERDLND